MNTLLVLLAVAVSAFGQEFKPPQIGILPVTGRWNSDDIATLPAENSEYGDNWTPKSKNNGFSLSTSTEKPADISILPVDSYTNSNSDDSTGSQVTKDSQYSTGTEFSTFSEKDRQNEDKSPEWSKQSTGEAGDQQSVFY